LIRASDPSRVLGRCVPTNLIQAFAFESSFLRIPPNETDDVARPMCLAGLVKYDPFGDRMDVNGLDLQLVAKLGVAFTPPRAHRQLRC
jgi:hypothetical protein